MCDFRKPQDINKITIGEITILQPEYIGTLWVGELGDPNYKEGFYQIVCTGTFYAYTDGFNWYSIDQSMEGHLIGNN